MGNLMSTVFCCNCIQKKPNYRVICKEGDQENQQFFYNNSKSLHTRESIRVTTNTRKSRVSSISKFNILANDLVLDKTENPADYYDKIDELGEGSFGKVFKVSNIVSGEIRALKVMNTVDADESEIFREGEILKGLSHPHIIKIFEVFYYRQNVYLVEEYLSGGDLWSKISKMDHLSEKVSLMIIYQILTAIHYLHTNNIVHGDLKLENVMIESLSKRHRATVILADDSLINQFDIKIIDFGCSSIFYKDKPLTKLVGTVYYLAPEVILGSYNNKCDIWSIGVILYILVSGRFPFDGETTDDITEKIVNYKYNLNGNEFESLGKNTLDLLAKLLEPDPYQRITAHQALNHPCFSSLKTMRSNSQKQEDICIKEAIANFKHLNHRIIFQKAIIKYISHHLVSKEEVNKIRSIYKGFDQNGDGYLTFDELCEGFRRVGIVVNEIEFKENFDSLDPQEKGVIEYEEFISVFMDKSKILEEKNLQAAFSLFDTEKQGTISRKSIQTIFQQNKYFKESTTQLIIDQLSFNDNNIISFEEFKQLMSSAY